MARTIKGCVRNCLASETGDTALAKTDKNLLVSLAAGGSYDYGEPMVEKSPITGDPTPYGVHLGYDDGAEKSSVSVDGLVVVVKDANAVAADVGKGIKPSTTKAGHATVVDDGGWYQVVAIESTDSPNLLVDLATTHPAPAPAVSQ